MKLSGVIDRVDTWEHEGKLYLRIVDYKTGTKSFRLDDVFYGRNLQMLIYLNVLRKYGAVRYGKEIVPAGIMYLPARSEIKAVKDTDGQSGSGAAKPLKRSGFVLDDGAVMNAWENSGEQVYIPVKKGREGGNPPFSAEQIDVLGRWVDTSLAGMSDDIGTGDISADPLFAGESDYACRTCEYKDQCGFRDGENGERMRIRRKMKDEDIWKLLKNGADSKACPAADNGGEADA